MSNKIQKQLEQLKREKKLMWALIFAFVTVVVWIIVSIVVSGRKHELSPELVKMSQPLVPSLDQRALDTLAQKRLFNDEDLEDFSIYALFDADRTGNYELVDVVQGRTVSIIDQTATRVTLEELMAEEEEEEEAEEEEEQETQEEDSEEEEGDLLSEPETTTELDETEAESSVQE